MADNPILTNLNLSCNYITAKGIIDLANNETLISLRLDYNHFDNSGVTAFADNKTLSSLSLKGIRHDNKGAITLLGNQTLTNLDLGVKFGEHNEDMYKLQGLPARNRKLQEAYLEILKKDLLVLLPIQDLVPLVQAYIPKFFGPAQKENKMIPLRPALQNIPASSTSIIFIPPLTSIKINLVSDQKKLLGSCKISNPKKCTQFMSFVVLVGAPLLCKVASEKAEYQLDLGILNRIQKANPKAPGEIAELLGMQEEELRKLAGNEVNCSIVSFQ